MLFSKRPFVRTVLDGRFAVGTTISLVHSLHRTGSDCSVPYPLLLHLPPQRVASGLAMLAQVSCTGFRPGPYAVLVVFMLMPSLKLSGFMPVLWSSTGFDFRVARHGARRLG